MKYLNLKLNFHRKKSSQKGGKWLTRFVSKSSIILVRVPNFGGSKGRRTGVGVTTVSTSLILGGWMTKVLKNGEKRGGRVGDNNFFIFLCYWLDKKCHFKKLHFGQFLLFVFVMFRNSYTSLLAWKLCHQVRNRTYIAVFSGPNQFY